MKIAITGGIGSGKSYVCKRLKARGIRVYDCDDAAKRLMRTDEVLIQRLRMLVGEDVYHGNILQKQVMARFMMLSDENTQAVNAIVHPAVARDFEQSGCQWLESAILYESGFYLRTSFDRVVCVIAPDEIRVRRVMKRDSISRTQAFQWLSKQWNQEEIRRRADYEILNDGIADIDKQLDHLLEKLKEIQ